MKRNGKKISIPGKVAEKFMVFSVEANVPRLWQARDLHQPEAYTIEGVTVSSP